MTPAAKKVDADFAAIVRATAPGERITYHTGDRAGGPYKYAAYAAYERGDVLLVQRRVGVALFDYLAVRVKKK